MSALVSQKAALAAREQSIAFRQRLTRVSSEAAERAAKLRRRADDMAANGKLAAAGASAASKAGIFAEAYAKKKLKPDTHKLLGPLASAVEVACLVAGAMSKRPADSMALFVTAGGFQGASSRFWIELADKTVGDKST